MKLIRLTILASVLCIASVLAGCASPTSGSVEPLQAATEELALPEATSTASRGIPFDSSSKEQYHRITRMFNQGDYAGAAAAMDEYASQQPAAAESETYGKCKSILQSILDEVVPQLTIVTNEVSGSSVAYGPGATQVEGDTHIVPFFSDAEMYLEVGFQAPSRLLFDKVEIRVAEDETISLGTFDYDSIRQETVGTEVIESAQQSQESPNTLLAIGSSSPDVCAIHFMGESNQTTDYSVSQAEIDACALMGNLQGKRVEFEASWELLEPV